MESISDSDNDSDVVPSQPRQPKRQWGSESDSTVLRDPEFDERMARASTERRVRARHGEQEGQEEKKEETSVAWDDSAEDGFIKRNDVKVIYVGDSHGPPAEDTTLQDYTFSKIETPGNQLTGPDYAVRIRYNQNPNIFVDLPVHYLQSQRFDVDLWRKYLSENEIPREISPRALIIGIMIGLNEGYAPPSYTTPHRDKVQAGYATKYDTIKHLVKLRTREFESSRVLDMKYNEQFYADIDDPASEEGREAVVQARSREMLKFVQMTNGYTENRVPHPAMFAYTAWDDTPIPANYLEKYIPRYFTPMFPGIKVSPYLIVTYKLTVMKKKRKEDPPTFSADNSLIFAKPSVNVRVQLAGNSPLIEAYQQQFFMNMMYAHNILVRMKDYPFDLITFPADMKAAVSKILKKDQTEEMVNAEIEKRRKYLTHFLGYDKLRNQEYKTVWRNFIHMFIASMRLGVPPGLFLEQSTIELINSIAANASQEATQSQKKECIIATLESGRKEYFPQEVCNILTNRLMEARYTVFEKYADMINMFEERIGAIEVVKKSGNVEKLFPELFPFQRQSVNWFNTMYDNIEAARRYGHGYEDASSGLILADDVGTGKTLQSCLFIASVIDRNIKQYGDDWRENTRILIVAPGITLGGWEDHLRDIFTAIFPDHFKFARDTQFVYRREDRSDPFKYDPTCPITWANFNVFVHVAQDSYDFLCDFKEWRPEEVQKEGDRVDQLRIKCAETGQAPRYEYDLMILDEVHDFRTAKKGFERVIQGRAKCSVGLSATLTVNNIADVICVYRLIAPGILRHFVEKFKTKLLNVRSEQRAQEFMAALKKEVEPFFLARRANEDQPIKFTTHCFQVEFTATEEEQEAFARHDKYLRKTATRVAINAAGNVQRVMPQGEFFTYVGELQKFGAYGLSAINGNPYNFRYILTDANTDYNTVLTWLRVTNGEQEREVVKSKKGGHKVKTKNAPSPWFNLSKHVENTPKKQEYDMYEQMYGKLLHACELVDLDEETRNKVRVWFIFIESFVDGVSTKKKTSKKAKKNQDDSSTLGAPQHQSSAEGQEEEEEADGAEGEEAGDRAEADGDDAMSIGRYHLSTQSFTVKEVLKVLVTDQDEEQEEQKQEDTDAETQRIMDRPDWKPERLMTGIFANKTYFPHADPFKLQEAFEMYKDDVLPGVDFLMNIRNFSYPFISVKFSTAFFTMNEILREHKFVEHMSAFGNKFKAIHALHHAAESDKARERDPSIVLKNIVFYMRIENMRLTCWWLRILSEGLKQVIFIFGSVSNEVRKARIRDFKARDDNNFILLTYPTAGVGVSLQNAHNLVLFDYSWTFKDEKQAIGRITRINQWGELVNVFRLVSEYSFDRKLINTIENKKKLWSILYAPPQDKTATDYECPDFTIEGFDPVPQPMLSQEDTTMFEGVDLTKDDDEFDDLSTQQPGMDIGAPRMRRPMTRQQEMEAMGRLFYYILTRDEDEFDNMRLNNITRDGIVMQPTRVSPFLAAPREGTDDEHIEVPADALMAQGSLTGSCDQWQQIVTVNEFNSVLEALIEKTHNLGPILFADEDEIVKEQIVQEERPMNIEEHKDIPLEAEEKKEEVERPRERVRTMPKRSKTKEPQFELANVVFWPPVQTDIDSAPAVDVSFVDVVAETRITKARQKKSVQIRNAELRKYNPGAGRKLLTVAERKKELKAINKKINARIEKGRAVSNERLRERALNSMPPGLDEELCDSKSKKRKLKNIKFLELVARFIYYDMHIRSLDRKIAQLRQVVASNPPDVEIADVKAKITARRRDQELAVLRFEHLRNKCKISWKTVEKVMQKGNFKSLSAIRRKVSEEHRKQRKTVQQVVQQRIAKSDKRVTKRMDAEFPDRDTLLQKVDALFEDVDVANGSTTDLVNQINAYVRKFPKLPGMSDKDRQEKVAEMEQFLALIIGRLADVGSYRTRYVAIRAAWSRFIDENEFNPDEDDENMEEADYSDPNRTTVDTNQLQDDDDASTSASSEQKQQQQEEEGEEEEEEDTKLDEDEEENDTSTQRTMDIQPSASATDKYTDFDGDENAQNEFAAQKMKDIEKLLNSMETILEAAQESVKKLQKKVYDSSSRIVILDPTAAFAPTERDQKTLAGFKPIFRLAADSAENENEREVAFATKVHDTSETWVSTKGLHSNMFQNQNSLTNELVMSMYEKYSEQPRGDIAEMDAATFRFIYFEMILFGASTEIEPGSKHYIDTRGNSGYALIDQETLFLSLLLAMIAMKEKGEDQQPQQPELLTAYVDAILAMQNEPSTSYFNFYTLFESKLLTLLVDQYGIPPTNPITLRAAQTVMAECIYEIGTTPEHIHRLWSWAQQNDGHMARFMGMLDRVSATASNKRALEQQQESIRLLANTELDLDIGDFVNNFATEERQAASSSSSSAPTPTAPVEKSAVASKRRKNFAAFGTNDDSDDEL